MAKGKKGKSKPRKPDKAKSSTSTDKDGSSTSKPSVTLKTPTSSPLDKNNYKVLQLKNGIRLLLISNEKSVPSPLWHHRSNHRKHPIVLATVFKNYDMMYNHE